MTGRVAWILIIVSAIWAAAVALVAGSTWPQLSMDLPPTDPAVQAVLDAARRNHVLWHAAIALAPPAVAFLAVKVFARGNERRP